MSKYLIVAYQTAGGPSLRTAIDDLASKDPAAEFLLLVPATRTQHLFTWTEGEAKSVAQQRAEAAASKLRTTGVRLTDVVVSDPDPFLAISNHLRDQPDYGAIIVSTFPAGISRWLRLDLPKRIGKTSGLPVIHVVVDPKDALAE